MVTDDIYSIAWLPDSEFELIYATENQINFVDTRQNFNKKMIVSLENQSKQINTIKFDPFNRRRFAAMSEDQIKIFDLRASNQILFSIKSEKEGMQSQELNQFGQTFSGLDWCLNRENLIVTYSKRSSLARFWDLVDDNSSPPLLTHDEVNTTIAANGIDREESKQNLLQAPNVLTDEYKVLNCNHEINGLAWKPRQVGQDKNKFVVYTTEGEICEFTFYERNYHVLDFSCKGEICISV